MPEPLKATVNSSLLEKCGLLHAIRKMLHPSMQQGTSVLALGHSDRLMGTKDERHKRTDDNTRERGTWPNCLNRTAGKTQ